MAQELEVGYKVDLAKSVLGLISTRTASGNTGRTPQEEFKALYKDVLFMVQNYVPGATLVEPEGQK